MIGERDRSILRDLAKIAEREGLEFFVIGAGARFLTHDWPHDLALGRGTTDWDIAVRVASWVEFERLKRSLTSADAPFRETTAEHRLKHVGGRHLDMVPYGGVEKRNHTVTYPRGKTTLSVLGLSECAPLCVRVPVGEGLFVPVLEPPGLVVLKARAYMERRPVQNHDVQDLDFMARTYAESLDGDRVFERAGTVLQEEAVTYEDVGAYLLARAVRDLRLPAEVLGALRQLIGELANPSSTAVSDLVPHQVADQERRRAAIARRYAAFVLGLSG